MLLILSTKPERDFNDRFLSDVTPAPQSIVLDPQGLKPSLFGQHISFIKGTFKFWTLQDPVWTPTPCVNRTRASAPTQSFRSGCSKIASRCAVFVNHRRQFSLLHRSLHCLVSCQFVKCAHFAATKVPEYTTIRHLCHHFSTILLEAHHSIISPKSRVLIEEIPLKINPAVPSKGTAQFPAQGKITLKQRHLLTDFVC